MGSILSFEPDDQDHEIDVRVLLNHILVELKRLNVMIAEMTDLNITNEDVQ